MRRFCAENGVWKFVISIDIDFSVLASTVTDVIENYRVSALVMLQVTSTPVLFEVQTGG